VPPERRRASDTMANGPDTFPADGAARLVPVPPLPSPSASRRHGRSALRNVTFLLLLRGLIIAGGMASAMVVPRTMGPATYGRYDLITMLTFLFTMLGSLGMGQVINRQTPQLIAEGATSRLQAIFGNLLALRALSGVTVALLYFLVTRLWLNDLDAVVLGVLSAAVLLRAPTTLCYSLFLGQGRIARWALPEVVRQWGSLAFALPCFLLGGLRGAVIGYLISEGVIFAIGLLGVRGTIALQSLRVDLRAVAPLLRVGLAFYASDLVLSAIERSGAVMLRAVTEDYAQVGIFGVSYQTFMAAVLSTNQIASSFVPLLTVLRSRRRDAELRLWVQRLVKWLAVAAVLIFLGSLTVGQDVVPLVLGRAFAPAYPNLVALAATLLLLPLSHVCSVLALTHDRPSVVFRGAMARLLVFWAAGLPLVMRWGSFGACVAVGFGVAAQATYLVALKWRVVKPAFRRWLGVVGLGLLFAPAFWLRGGPLRNAVLFIVTAGSYLLVLRIGGAISARDLRVVYRALGVTRGTRLKGDEGAP
jgi:O-antigen/teichoic acid export membrane protein